VGQEYRCVTAAEMAAHLVAFHRARGDRVPDEGLSELKREAEGGSPE
jgi:hypothetical protein